MMLLIFRLIFITLMLYFSSIYSLNTTDTIDTEQEDHYDDLFKQAPSFLLTVHNKFRKKHNVPILKASKKLNELSKSWAEELAQDRKIYHMPQNEYGENIYWEDYRTGLHYPGLFVHHWYNEIYNFRRYLRFNEVHLISNFTQIIWKSTKYLGCAAIPNRAYEEVYLVCMYDPPGNIIEEFNENIDVEDLIPDLESKARLNHCARHCINLFLLFIIITIYLMLK